MDTKRIGSLSSGKGAGGLVHRLRSHGSALSSPGSGAYSWARVTFEPGAHTAWHTHPLGRAYLSPLAAAGLSARAARWRRFTPGDVIWFAPPAKYWHSASLFPAVTRVAIQERLNGKVVDCLEHITDERYRQ